MTVTGETRAQPPRKTKRNPIKDLLELWRESGRDVPKFVKLLNGE